MTETITKADRVKSRLTERLAGDPFQIGTQELPLCTMKSDDGRARAWRVTMSRAERKDNFALLAPNDPQQSIPLFTGQFYNYTAGFQGAPSVPPRRTNPVFGTGGAGNIGSIFVEIRFGQSEGRPLMMLGHWPMLGGSVVVYGSFVEVWGGFRITAPLTDGVMASLQAMITPCDGLAPADAGELGLTQEVLLEPAPPNGAVLYVPDFARRVRITNVAFANERVPATGEVLTQLVWYDERGLIVDGALHGQVGSSDLYSPDIWYAVPPAAVLLGMYRVVAADNFALVHWRIAP